MVARAITFDIKKDFLGNPYAKDNQNTMAATFINMGFDKDTDKLLKFIILFVFENRETRKDQFFWHLL